MPKHDGVAAFSLSKDKDVDWKRMSDEKDHLTAEERIRTKNVMDADEVFAGGNLVREIFVNPPETKINSDKPGLHPASAVTSPVVDSITVEDTDLPARRTLLGMTTHRNVDSKTKRSAPIIITNQQYAQLVQQSHSTALAQHVTRLMQQYADAALART